MSTLHPPLVLLLLLKQHLHLLMCLLLRLLHMLSVEMLNLRMLRLS